MSQPDEPEDDTAGSLASLERALATVLSLATLFVFASTLVFLGLSHWAGPITDFWLFIPEVAALERGEATLAELFGVHGGHRLVLPKLFYHAEYLWFDGRNVFLVACNVALQAATAGLLLGAIWQARRGLHGWAASFMAASVVLFLFSSSQIDNFARGWNLSYFFVWTAMASSLAALCRARAALDTGRRGATTWLFVCIAAAGAAIYSMAMGLLAFPILLILAVRLGLPRSHVAALAVCCLAFSLPFFVGYEPRALAEQRPLAELPIPILSWVLACLGAPLSWTQPVAGRALGLVGAITSIVLWLRFLRGDIAARPVATLCIGLSMFGIGSVLLTSYGRATQFDLPRVSARYQTIVLPVWLSLVMLLALRSAGPTLPDLRRRCALLAAMLVAAGLVLVPAHMEQGRAMMSFAGRIRVANDAIIAGTRDHRAYLESVAFRDQTQTDPIAKHRAFLREQRLGMFSGQPASWIGRSIGDDIQDAGTPCRGELDGVFRFEGPKRLNGAELSGWVAARGEREVRKILVATKAGRILGLGSPIDRIEGSGATRTKWAAYVGPVRRDAPLFVWMLSDGDEACRLAGPFEIGDDAPTTGT